VRQDGRTIILDAIEGVQKLRFAVGGVRPDIKSEAVVSTISRHQRAR
jgi:hypothetical protein